MMNLPPFIKKPRKQSKVLKYIGGAVAISIVAASLSANPSSKDMNYGKNLTDTLQKNIEYTLKNNPNVTLEQLLKSYGSDMKLSNTEQLSIFVMEEMSKIIKHPHMDLSEEIQYMQINNKDKISSKEAARTVLSKFIKSFEKNGIDTNELKKTFKEGELKIDNFIVDVLLKATESIKEEVDYYLSYDLYDPNHPTRPAKDSRLDYVIGEGDFIYSLVKNIDKTTLNEDSLKKVEQILYITYNLPSTSEYDTVNTNKENKSNIQTQIKKG